MSIKIGKNSKIGSLSSEEGYKLRNSKAEIIIGDNVTFGKDVVINVTERLVIGDRSIIGDHFVIEGRDIEIGKEFWSGRYCSIGGGSCFEKPSKLKIGDQCHLGDFGMINTARKVIIGDEVGMGQGTKIYTHGAYLNYFNGFPVDFGPITIESRVWLPNAIVMPNVTIGHDTVVGAGAVVTKSLPSGCLAVGTPAKVIKENCYPKKLSDKEFMSALIRFIDHFKSNIVGETMVGKLTIIEECKSVYLDECMTLFDFGNMRIDGKATELTEKFRDELRRWGIRFKYYNDNGVYKPW